MATGTTDRAAAVALWKDLWQHVVELERENGKLRRKLNQRPRRDRVAHPTEPPLPLEVACDWCGALYSPRSHRGRAHYCSDGCREEVRAEAAKHA